MEISKVVMVLLSISSMWAVSMAQSSSGISSSCTNELLTLSPCLNYITGNSSKPSSDCCTQLASVVKSSPQCLCEVLNGGGSSLAAGLNINQTQALGLPKACDVQTPPLSSCASSPSSSPAPTGTSSTTPSFSSGGSKTTPTTQGDSSDANMSKLTSLPLLLALLYVVAHGLTFNAA